MRREVIKLERGGSICVREAMRGDVMVRATDVDQEGVLVRLTPRDQAKLVRALGGRLSRPQARAMALATEAGSDAPIPYRLTDKVLRDERRRRAVALG